MPSVVGAGGRATVGHSVRTAMNGADAMLEVERELPDLVLCDGQGIAHPRRFGIACHLGVLLNLPAIGVGKSKLVGEFEEPEPQKGAWSRLMHKGERIGTVLRSRTASAEQSNREYSKQDSTCESN